MKHEVFVLVGQRIDQKSNGREARGNEEGEKREDEKGSHCFFKSSGYDKLELKPQNLFFFKLMECIIKMSWNAKICAIGEQNVIN